MKSITYTHYCNNDVLQTIAEHCHRLEVLDVNFSGDVTDNGVTHFLRVEEGKNGNVEVPCPLLTEIHLKRTRVSSEGVAELLKTLPLLKIVNSLELPMALMKIHSMELFTFPKLKFHNLTHLDLSDNCFVYYDHINEVGLKACVSLCPNLKSVIFSVYKSEHLNLCSVLPDAADLNLRFYSLRVTREEISDFLRVQGGKITQLHFCNGITVPLSVLGKCCPRLEELRLEWVNVQYDEKFSTPAFNSLKTFSVLYYDLFSPSNCEGISQVLRLSLILNELTLLCISLPPEMKTAILKCCSQAPLKYINLFYGKVDKDFADNILACCPTLKIFRLSTNTVCSR